MVAIERKRKERKSLFCRKKGEEEEEGIMAQTSHGHRRAPRDDEERVVLGTIYTRKSHKLWYLQRNRAGGG